MFSPRQRIFELLQQGAIAPDKLVDALKVAKVIPDAKAWRHFIDQLLLWLGSLALVFSLLFFIAYNWNELGRFAKFGMIELSLVLSVAAYWKFYQRDTLAKVMLLAACILLGVLLAFYGQTYQTGADPWQLFFNWALLILPWTIIGRFAAIWLIWLALINLSLMLYFETFRSVLWIMLGTEEAVLWLLFTINTVALIIWERLSKNLTWLQQRWAVHLVALGGGVPVTWLAMDGIFNERYGGIWPGLTWFLWLLAIYYVYRRLKPDLFMLAGGCLSGIVVVITFLSKHLLENADAGGFLFLSLMVIGLGAGATFWLRNIHRQWRT